MYFYEERMEKIDFKRDKNKWILWIISTIGAINGICTSLGIRNKCKLLRVNNMMY